MTPSPSDLKAAGAVSGKTDRHLLTVLHEHASLLGFVCFYLVGAGVFFLATGHWDDWVLRWSYPWFTLLFTTGSAILVFMRRTHWTPDRVAGAVLVAVVSAPFQSTFNSVKQVIGDVRGYPWDVRFAEADRWLHFGRHPWEWFSPLVAHPDAVRVLDFSYILWFPVLAAFVVWVAWASDRALRRRALLAAALVWVLCGNVAALIFSSAGPCYYDAVVAGSNPYARLVGTLQSYHEQEFLWARSNQISLWNAMQSETWLPFGGISAMPSLHIAMAVLWALIARRRNRTAGMLLAVFAAVTLLGSVVLGWHYAIDGYAGGLMAYAIWRATRWL